MSWWICFNHICIIYYRHPNLTNSTHALLCKKPCCIWSRVAEVNSLAELEGLRSQAPRLNHSHKQFSGPYVTLFFSSEYGGCYCNFKFNVIGLMLDPYPWLILLSSYFSIAWNDAKASPQNKLPEETLPATESQLDASVRGTPQSGPSNLGDGSDVGSHAPVSPASSLPSSKGSDEVTFRELENSVFQFPGNPIQIKCYKCSSDIQMFGVAYIITWSMHLSYIALTLSKR